MHAHCFPLPVLCSHALVRGLGTRSEAHAVDTYGEFADANKELLQSMEAPRIAKQYYEAADLYVFDEFQTSRPRGSRRPTINSLYDVVCCIRDDEAEHVATMAACQDPDVVIKSPNTEAAIVTLAVASGVTAALLLSSNFLGGGGTDSLDASLVDADSAAGSLAEVAGNVAAGLSDAAAAASGALATKMAASEALREGVEQSESVLQQAARADPQGLWQMLLRLLKVIR